jgi:hypothetical protein
MTHQGSSEHTARKEFEIEGVTKMRFCQFKSKYFHFPTVICADVFCGTGTNTVGDEVVDGSPVRLLRGYLGSKNTQRKVNFWFSDIRKAACDHLQNQIKRQFGQDLTPVPMAASDAINVLGDYLQRNPATYLFLVLDPNGPKDFPKGEVENLLTAYSGRIDVIPYISATTINRCIGARNKAGMDFQGWLGEIENFDTGFVAALSSGNRKGWIREPLNGDRQRWTMIPTFGRMAPKNDWRKQGYVALDGDEGRSVVDFYCGRK